MDIELLKSATEEQLEMMLMMQMEKLPPEYSSGGAYSDEATGLQIMNFSPQQLMDHNSNNTFSINMPPINQEPSTWRETVTENQFSSFPTQHQKRATTTTSMAAMREMIFRIAAMQPIHIDPEAVKPPKRRNVKISSDPQSVAARHRRERISERIRILQRLVPGGTKMDTASMLDEAIHYVKFLKKQVQSLEQVAAGATRPPPATAATGFPVPMMSSSMMNGNYNFFPMTPQNNVHHYVDSQLTN